MTTPAPQARQLVFVMEDTGDVPVTANPFFGEVLQGVEATCQSIGMNVIFRTLPFPTSSADELISSLQNLAFDGLILNGPFQTAIIDAIATAFTCPLVLVDNTIPAIPYDTVMTDDFGGGYQATRHLLDLGHRRITMILGQFERPSFVERYRGYSAACRAAGLEPREPVLCSWDRAAIHQRFAQLMRAADAPTALFCSTDHYAVYGIDALRNLGYSLPQDISVVGFDNLALAPLSSVPLTTMSSLPRILGQVSVQRLLARLNGDTTPPQAVALRTQLFIRESTAQPRHDA
jgi:LacI family transcriptional regulator